MAAIAVMMGTSRYTVRQYQTFNRLMNEKPSEHEKMPTYNTVLYSIYPAMFKICFAPHLFVNVRVNPRAAGVVPAIRYEAERGRDQ